MVPRQREFPIYKGVRFELQKEAEVFCIQRLFRTDNVLKDTQNISSMYVTLIDPTGAVQ